MRSLNTKNCTDGGASARHNPRFVVVFFAPEAPVERVEPTTAGSVQNVSRLTGSPSGDAHRPHPVTRSKISMRSGAPSQIAMDTPR